MGVAVATARRSCGAIGSAASVQNESRRRSLRQACNACTSLALVCRFAQRASQRLAQLRERAKREWVETILADVRREIQKTKPPRTPTAQQSAPNNQATAAPVYQPIPCPFCTVAVASNVHTGQVHHCRACGNKFRVHSSGVSGRIHKHACPRRGTIVSSSQVAGRIQVKHKTPAGKTCRQEKWQT